MYDYSTNTIYIVTTQLHVIHTYIIYTSVLIILLFVIIVNKNVAEMTTSFLQLKCLIYIYISGILVIMR